MYDFMVNDFQVDFLKFYGAFKPKLLVIFSMQRIILIEKLPTSAQGSAYIHL